jgi:hypothetical protein
MPLQQSLQQFPTSLQLGHEATTQSQWRFNFQAYADLTHLNAQDLLYGMMAARQSDGTWAVVTAATAGNQCGIVMYDFRLSTKSAYKTNELLNLEMVGDRIVKCIPGLTIKAGDPIFVYVATGNAGLFSNVADATPANTRRVKGMFLDDKPATDQITGIAFDLFAGLA